MCWCDDDGQVVVVNGVQPPGPGMDSVRCTGNPCQCDGGTPRMNHVSPIANFPWTADTKSVNTGNGTNLVKVEAKDLAVEGPSVVNNGRPATGAAIHHGAKYIINQRKSMEDFYYAQERFIQLPLSVADTEEILPAFLCPQEEINQQVKLARAVRSWTAVVRYLQPTSPPGICVLDDFHLFAVFDGHGGPEISRHCSLYMHQHLHKALTLRLRSTHLHLVESQGNQCSHVVDTTGLENKNISVNSNATNLNFRCCWSSCQGPEAILNRNEDVSGKSTETSLMETCDVPEVSLQIQSIGKDAEMAEALENGETQRQNSGVGLTAWDLQASMIRAFEDTDKEVKDGGNSSFQGSTAVAALVGTWHICVASCGDSRAVLYREGRAVRVTHDHKPGDDVEQARIESAGGRVVTINGCARVNGLLAMSRAIGDSVFPWVVARPEVTVVHRSCQDEFLVLASDGLFDVLSDQEACDLAKRCMARAASRGARPSMAAKVAASVLTRAAIGRGSMDNITVVVVDLRRCRNHDRRE